MTRNPQLSSKAGRRDGPVWSHLSQTAQRCSRVGAGAEAILQPLVSTVNFCFRKSSRTSVFSVCNTLPKHAASQAATLVGTPQEHTTHSLDKTSRKPSSDADKLHFLGPSQERWRSTASRSTRVPGRDPNLERFWHAPPSQVGITGSTRISATIDGKTAVEALQFLITFGATLPPISVDRTVRGVDPWMSQSSFTNFDRTGTTFKDPRKSFWQHFISAAHP